MIYSNLVILRVLSALVVFSILIPLSVQAQTLLELETKYESLKNTLTKEKQVLDSLTRSLEERAELIDYEKSKSKADKDKIIKLMAGSVLISNAIESQQKYLSQLEEDFETTKIKLNKQYALIIDSLQELKKSSKNKFDTNEIDLNILKITEKKLLLAPKIKELSFHPEKILAIDLPKSKDSIQKNIFIEYLTSALREVDALLAQVNETSREISQIITLQKKARKFVEDVEFEHSIKSTVSKSEQAVVFDGRIKNNEEIRGSYLSEFEPFIIVYKQLDIQQLSAYRASKESFVSFSDKQMNLKDYQELLEELKRQLSEYSTIISNKLKITR